MTENNPQLPENKSFKEKLASIPLYKLGISVPLPGESVQTNTKDLKVVCAITDKYDSKIHVRIRVIESQIKADDPLKETTGRLIFFVDDKPAHEFPVKLLNGRFDEDFNFSDEMAELLNDPERCHYVLEIDQPQVVKKITEETKNAVHEAEEAT